MAALPFRKPEKPSETHPYNSGDRDVVVRIMNFIVSVFVFLLLTRLVLKTLNAKLESSFTSFIYDLTQPMVGPFEDIFSQSTVEQNFAEPGTFVAIFVFALTGYGMVYIVKLIKHPE